VVNVENIKTEADYAKALARVEKLMDAEAGTREADELDVLATLIESYEEKHHPIEPPDPIAALQFRMEQEGLSNKDLIPFIGSSAKVSEVLSGKRDLTLSMIRALHRHLGIPAEVLIQEAGGTIPEDDGSIEWERFPVAEMARRGLLAAKTGIKDTAEKIMRDLMRRAGLETVPTPLFRKNDSARRNARMDSYALAAWCIYVLSEARRRKRVRVCAKGIVTQKFLREVAQLSIRVNGPKEAVDFLARQGIILVVVPHLANTYLDGAAMLLDDGTPVIGMTIRYDRLDNFWFCLLHELAHVGRHMEGKGEKLFVDDFELRVGENDKAEKEADEWANEALVPWRDWNEHPAQDAPTVGNVIALAQQVKVHPAIVAGRIRRQYADYRKLTQLVGAGEVRKHFDRIWN
jgi:HTH-type transcriptional regulator/antitoxin HigA